MNAGSKLLFTLAAGLACLSSVWATPTLKLTSGAITKTIFDGSTIAGSTDANTAAGVVTYIGAVGSWKINVTTGITDPTEGTPALPFLDLSSVDTSSSSPTAPPNLVIQFSDIDFGPSPNQFLTQFQAAIGGTTQGSISYEVFADPSNNGNNLFSHQTTLIDLGPFSGGAFSGSETVAALTAAHYSMTLQVTISHPRGSGSSSKTTSFDATLTGVPDGGSTLLLLGSGLLGLLFFVRVGHNSTPKT